MLRVSFVKMADAVADFIAFENDRFQNLEGRVQTLEAKAQQ